MPSAATQMNLGIIILSEVSQKEKDKYHVTSLICGIQNMTQMNLLLKQKQKHRHRKQICVCQRGEEIEERRNGSLGSGRQTIIYRTAQQGHAV